MTAKPPTFATAAGEDWEMESNVDFKQSPKPKVRFRNFLYFV